MRFAVLNPSLDQFGLGASYCGSRLEQDIQIVRMSGAKLRFFAVDVTVAHQSCKGIFQRERAFFLGDGNFLMQMLKSIAANAVARAVADHEEFRGWHAAARSCAKD